MRPIQKLVLPMGSASDQTDQIDQMNQTDQYSRVALEKIVEILKGYGARKVILFGSIARGEAHSWSDIDVACEGLAPEKFFKALGEILSELGENVDVVDLGDVRHSFRSRIEREGILLYESS